MEENKIRSPSPNKWGSATNIPQCTAPLSLNHPLPLKVAKLDLSPVSNKHRSSLPLTETCNSQISTSPSMLRKRSSFGGSKFGKLSIKSSELATPDPGNDYYQLDLPGDASEQEVRIYNFLKSEGVRMAHPSEKKKKDFEIASSRWRQERSMSFSQGPYTPLFKGRPRANTNKDMGFGVLSSPGSSGDVDSEEHSPPSLGGSSYGSPIQKTFAIKSKFSCAEVVYESDLG